MKALVFDGRLHVSTDAPVPRPPGEALIEVRVAGICGTDIEITRGYKGFCGVLGHEFVGDVVEAPDPEWVGERVCGEINVRCGDCRWCLTGMGTHCVNRTVLGILGRSGAFAQYLSLPLQNLHRVPESVSDDQAVYVEPLAAAYQILDQVTMDAAQRVLIIGDGKLGLLCAQVLATTGASVTILGRHHAKLVIAKHLGLETVHESQALPQNLDLVVEATGSPTGFELACDLLRPRGTLVLKSTVGEAISVDLSVPVVKELNVVGSRCGPFPPALAALASGAIAVDPLTEARYKLDDGVRAMELAASRGVLKVLIDMA